MQIVYRPVGQDLPRAIEAIRSYVHEERAGQININSASDAVIRIADSLQAPDRSNSLRTLAKSFLVELKIPELAMTANAIYKGSYATPEVLEKDLVDALYISRNNILELETGEGKGEPGRITLGGIFKPGIRLGVLDDGELFAKSAISESFLCATRDSGPGSDLAKIFPQYVFKPREESSVPAIKPHLVNLSAHVGCCHDGSH